MVPYQAYLENSVFTFTWVTEKGLGKTRINELFIPIPVFFDIFGKKIEAKCLFIHLFSYSFLFTNLGRPINAQHCSPMVVRWPCSLENVGPTSLPPIMAWGGIPKERT